MYRDLILSMGARAFVMEVKTDNSGTSTSTQFTIPTTGTGFNYSIRTQEHNLSGQTGNVTLTFATAGTYTVEIRGAFPRIFFNGGGDRLKVLRVIQWGDIAWTAFQAAFSGCSNMDVTASDTPRSSSITQFASCFLNCSSLVNSNGSIGYWDVSSASSLASFFSGASLFNQNLGLWNVSSATTFTSMFLNATAFNNGGSSSINNWQIRTTGTVVMGSMFSGASAFNQPLGSWNTSAVTNMSIMFNASGFNQDISSWNTSAVTTMASMFASSPFNQNINTSGSSWNVSLVNTMSSMFSGATAFNGNITSWNTSAVTTMQSMFSGASAFNQNISSWTVSSVTSVSFMFSNATSFNQNISTWNVLSVTTFDSIFSSASAFNQNLGTWTLKLTGITSVGSFFRSSGMSTANYTDTIVGWANYIKNNSGPYSLSLATQTGRTFQNSRSGGANFANAQAARTYLTTAVGSGGAGWSITGDTVIS